MLVSRQGLRHRTACCMLYLHMPQCAVTSLATMQLKRCCFIAHGFNPLMQVVCCAPASYQSDNSLPVHGVMCVWCGFCYPSQHVSSMHRFLVCSCWLLQPLCDSQCSFSLCSTGSVDVELDCRGRPLVGYRVRSNPYQPVALAQLCCAVLERV